MQVVHNLQQRMVYLSSDVEEEEKRFKQTWGKIYSSFKNDDGTLRFNESNLFMAKIINFIAQDCSLGGEVKIPTSYLDIYNQGTIGGRAELPTWPKWSPLEWQKQPIQEALFIDGPYAFLLEKGAGKTSTIQACMSDLQRRKGDCRFLWITKGYTLQDDARKQCLKFFPNLHPVVIEGTSVKEKAKKVFFNDIPGVVYILNYESFRPNKDGTPNPLVKELISLPETKEKLIFTAICLDESSKIRNHTRHGDGIMQIQKTTKRRYIASGNPAPQSPTDYVHQMNFLHKGILPYNTIHAMMKAWAVRTSYNQAERWRKDGIATLNQRVAKVGHVLSKERLEELGLTIPTLYKTYEIKMTEKQQTAYDEMVNFLVTQVEMEKKKINDQFSQLMNDLWGGSETPELMSQKNAALEMVAQNILVKMLRLTQITGGFYGAAVDFETEEIHKNVPIDKVNPKLDAIIEEVLERKKIVFTDDGDVIKVQQPLVVFLRFRAEINYVTEKLKKEGVRCESIQGGSEKKNAANITRFQGGELDVLVVNQASGMFGLNLQRGEAALYGSNSFSLEERDQSEARVRRYGQKASRVEIIDFVCKGSIDISTLARLRQKKELSELVLFKFEDLITGKLSSEDEYNLNGYLED